MHLVGYSFGHSATQSRHANTEYCTYFHWRSYRTLTIPASFLYFPQIHMCYNTIAGQCCEQKSVFPALTSSLQFWQHLDCFSKAAVPRILWLQDTLSIICDCRIPSAFFCLKKSLFLCFMVALKKTQNKPPPKTLKNPNHKDSTSDSQKRKKKTKQSPNHSDFIT